MRRLLSPRWVARHVAALALVALCLRLGWWQWDRARSIHGTLQNLGYAIQWPIFAGFVGFFWWKLVRPDERDGAAPQRAPEEERAASLLGAAPTPGSAAAATAPAVEDELDEELAAYNRYLASLAERDGRRR